MRPAPNTRDGITALSQFALQADEVTKTLYLFIFSFNTSCSR